MTDRIDAFTVVLDDDYRALRKERRRPQGVSL
jgi:hypothetical protein